ncbi:MAG: uroporphyrinogen-III C-methyltransferase [bacterium]|nr:uroporphyrinogen-III C-methyltransferase [bacterium]
MNFGKVILAGAGPGDPGLLTIKTRDALSRADVVMYDYLVHPSVLQYSCPTAILLCVGKAKGQHSMKQQDINATMVQHAKQGKYVVRLKGGDPCVFGRLGEELECLTDAEIPFEIVPGISSTIAVPAYAGIPLTHRDMARSFAVVTGTLRTGNGEANLAIPDADTLVFVMAVTHLEKIVSQLMEMGRGADLPAALIFRGTTAQQKVVVGTLGTIVALRDSEGVEPPAILVVGEVARLSERYDWWNGLPLAGERVIVLRTVAQGGELAARLRELGADVVQLPMIEIVPVLEAKLRFNADLVGQSDLIVFTSPNGVTQSMDALFSNGCDARVLAGKTVVAIGPKTASVLRDHGVVADVVARRSVQEGIVDELPHDLTGTHVLLPTSAKARDTLSDALVARGARVTELGLYDTVMPALPEGDFVLRDGDKIVFTSSSTVRHFFESGLVSNQAIRAYSLGPVTSATIAEYFGGHIVEANSPSVDALIYCIMRE